MRSKYLKKIAAIFLTAALALSLAACSSGEDSSEAESGTDQINAAQGGSIALPEGLVAPENANTMVTQFQGGQLSGAFSLINYKATGYFTHGGSVTVTVRAESSQEGTQWTDAYISLWKKGDNTTEFVETAHFQLDGSEYTYTFADLDAAAEYRVTFTYNDVPSYKMSGAFAITGVTMEDTAGEPEDGAQDASAA